MKINDSNKNAVNLGIEKAATEKANNAKADAQKSSSAADAKPKDSVTLSPIAQQLKEIESSISTGGVFDASKVNEIKDAISKGEFKVDTGKVADGLIQSVKEMLSNKT